MKPLRVEIVRVDETLPLPQYQTKQSSGMDLYASLPNTVYLEPRQRTLIKTGIKISIPDGYEAQVRPRSGLAFKEGVTVVNTPGSVDGDFTGEICVILINHSPDTPFVIQHGTRIAQLVFAPIVQAVFDEVDSLKETERGEGGFGHTGK